MSPMSLRDEPEQVDLLTLIRRGINDPGSVLPRLRWEYDDEGIGAWGARAVQRLLTDAGLLVEPGSEARDEWAVEMTAKGAPDGVPLDMGGAYGYRTTAINSESIARGVAREAERHSPPVRIMRRIVHTGPWRAE